MVKKDQVKQNNHKLPQNNIQLLYNNTNDSHLQNTVYFGYAGKC